MRIIEARAKKNITQWDMAIITGISQSKISLIERGYIKPSEDEKRKIISALGIPEEEIQWPVLKEPVAVM